MWSVSKTPVSSSSFFKTYSEHSSQEHDEDAAQVGQLVNDRQSPTLGNENVSVQEIEARPFVFVSQKLTRFATTESRVNTRAVHALVRRAHVQVVARLLLMLASAIQTHFDRAGVFVDTDNALTTQTNDSTDRRDRRHWTAGRSFDCD